MGILAPLQGGQAQRELSPPLGEVIKERSDNLFKWHNFRGLRVNSLNLPLEGTPKLFLLPTLEVFVWRGSREI